MRSMTCNWSECGSPARSIQVLSFRPIVSTTSVSPSYRPMEFPIHVKSGSLGCWRPSVDLANMVIKLEQLNHPARGLNDLKYKGLNIDPWHAGRQTPDIFPRGRIHVVSRIVDCPGSVGRLRGQVSLLTPRRHRGNIRRTGIIGPCNVAHVAFPNSRQVHCGGS